MACRFGRCDLDRLRAAVGAVTWIACIHFCDLGLEGLASFLWLGIQESINRHLGKPQKRTVPILTFCKTIEVNRVLLSGAWVWIAFIPFYVFG